MLYIPDLSFIDDKSLINSDYKVTANGKECTVRACRVSAMPFNRAWPNHQRDKKQTEIAKHLGISQVQVSRIEKQILNKMRDKML